MIERENTRPTLVECCAWFDCFFVHAVGVLFPALFSHPFLRAWQGWSCLLVLVYSLVFLHPPSFLSFSANQRTKLSLLPSKTTTTMFACSSLAFLLGVWNHSGVFAATSGAGLWSGTSLVRLHGRRSLFGNQPNDFSCCRLVPTSGKQALDDDALGGKWDGVVEEKRKGKRSENGV